MIKQLSRKMEQKKKHAIKRNQTFDSFKDEIQKLADNWNSKWNKLVAGPNDKRFLYNWLTILYVIPRYESFIMLIITTFALTSYNVHPLGCLSHIDVFYNEAEKTVTVKISENVIRYQQASVILIGMLSFHWLAVKIIQYLLLPRRWGLLINNCFSLNLLWTGPCVINCLFKKCKCPCEQTKGCSLSGTLPCGENMSHYDEYC